MGQESAREWRANWTLVASSTAGFSFATIAAASIGLFMVPLSQEFGWSRAEISLGLTMYALMAVPLSPFVGALIDRWGSRRLALPGVLLSACAFAAFGLLTGSLVHWFAVWIVYSIVALGVKGTVWTAAISSVFSAGRGLALAVTLSGSAIAMTLVPVIAQWLIDNQGWRIAYIWLGLGWGAFVLALLVPFFFDAGDRAERSQRSGTEPAPRRNAVLQGLSIAQAIRSLALLKIGAATLVTVVLVSAVSVHQIPMLTGQGVTRQTAAMAAASAGLASIAGKLATGWMLDRWKGGWISGFSLMLPAMSYVILLNPAAHIALVFLAIAVIGYSNGAFVQISAYMTGRYGGLRNFGKIYGTIASVTALGVGIGPVLAGAIFDTYGSYWLLLVSGIPLALISRLLMIRLGPYPDWEGEAAKHDLQTP